ncbi:uncharacterized protein L969DRAFT_96830 [Mixia osmundae IAM 14324]|uniref:Uncharacterized protein n=1 Tax=Mixia osmundae (strain CBS 9802 / IAM 14324 / JCM 22182 / KY 12970) TaxID=764103 RepID=G7E277_MIXOS|nr:uncharacterized protein L969DRAFT_96830 [Mixia osmundae IAM 14324]KEI36809.1 hypothetical protein L969DRAFT_96830 [Mixia osmundae IAM 14324]GAA96937.1 hypothetical protein E5Q_03611 [Mixia osmundae IAM 14324]
MLRRKSNTAFKPAGEAKKCKTFNSVKTDGTTSSALCALYEQHTFDAILESTADLITRLASEATTKGPITRFHAKQPPEVGLRAYLTRLVQYTPYSHDAILLLLLYIYRLPKAADPTDTVSPLSSKSFDEPTDLTAPYLRTGILQPHEIALRRQDAASSSSSSLSSLASLDSVASLPSLASTSSSSASSITGSSFDLTRPSDRKSRFRLRKREQAPPVSMNTFTMHRLVLATLLVASKFISDSHITQTRAAKVGGLTPMELRALEIDVLFELDCRLTWTKDEMDDIARLLCRTMAKASAPETDNPTVRRKSQVERPPPRSALVRTQSGTTPSLAPRRSVAIITPSSDSEDASSLSGESSQSDAIATALCQTLNASPRRRSPKHAEVSFWAMREHDEHAQGETASGSEEEEGASSPGAHSFRSSRTTTKYDSMTPRMRALSTTSSPRLLSDSDDDRGQADSPPRGSP